MLRLQFWLFSFFFFFNDTATTEIYTLSLHDALPISVNVTGLARSPQCGSVRMFTLSICTRNVEWPIHVRVRSEEHTSELQSRLHLVCRLLLEKKKKTKIITQTE